MTDKVEDSAGAGFNRTLLIAGLCGGFIVSQFLRNAMGVIAPDLAVDVGMDADELGVLGGAFFFSFAVAQIPVGVAIDRYGPRAVMVTMFGLVIAGCIVIAVAQTLTQLILARILMGLGCACLFMGPLTVVSRWFPAGLYAGYVSLLLAIGSIGTLGATAPLGWASSTLGWRTVFVLVAVLAAAAAAATAAWVADAPPGHAFHNRARETVKQSFAGVVEVLRQRDVIPVFIMNLAVYAVSASMLALWGGPYLNDVYGLDGTARGAVLFVMAACQVAGLAVWGRMDRLTGSRKWPVVAGSGLTMLLLCVFVFGPKLPLAGLYMLFGAFGLVCAYVPLLMAHGRALFEDRLVGRGITLLNTAVMAGVFVMQVATGFAIEFASDGSDGPAQPGAYRACFGVMLGGLAAATFAYLFADDRQNHSI